MATRILSKGTAALMAIALGSITTLVAQTVVKPPKNRYTPQQDVELGREAAAEVRQQYPVIEDAADRQVSRQTRRSTRRRRAAASSRNRSTSIRSRP